MNMVIKNIENNSPVDFLINYEHKNREIEVISFIKLELERRGYSVELSCTYDENRIDFTDWRPAKVVVTPALYNDASLFAFVYRIAGLCSKVVNFQWEQALTNELESDPFFYQNPKGFAKQAVHLCWGVEPRLRMLRSGVPDNKAVVVGPPQMDSLRPQFSGFYKSKEEIASIFKLNSNKEWVLFISSFTFVNMPTEEYETEVQCLGTWLDGFKTLSINSKNEIMKWLEVGMQKYPEKIFIYRPHPSEAGDPSLSIIEAKYPNFRVIKELSVKQWIMVCEKILTWYSTSIAEVYFAGKPCTILRPEVIPYEWDVTIYREAEMITTLPGFLNDLEEAEHAFPLNSAIIKNYFDVDPETPSFIRICDLLERVYKEDDFNMKRRNRFFILYIHFQRFRHRLFFIFKEKLAKNKYAKMIIFNKFLLRKIQRHIEFMERMQNDREKNQASLNELTELNLKIKNSQREVYVS